MRWTRNRVLFFENVLKIHVPEAGTVLFDNPKGETNHHLSVYIKHSAFVFKLWSHMMRVQLVPFFTNFTFLVFRNG